MTSSPDSIIGDSAQRLKCLKGLYAGKACVVIGNGPSLCVEDLELVWDCYTFGVNKIYDIYSATSWRPFFYVIQDFKLMKAIFTEAKKAVRDSHYRFFNARILNYISPLEDAGAKDFYFRLNNDWDIHPRQSGPSFSKDISICAYEGYTVIYTALQIAVYMGFSRIYLLGVDHSYSVPNGGAMSGLSAKDYFTGCKPLNGITLNAPQLERSTAAFAVARAYCDSHGIQIYNATRGGNLEVFPRVSFAQALKALTK